MNELRKRIRERIQGRLPASGRGYEIRNADAEKAVVRIYDEIWLFGVNAEDLASELDGITAPEIEVQINSPGGDVFDGVAIFNALRTHPARVTTRVDGVAASAASVIVQAGDHRVMLTGAQQMIHNSWGLVIGPASEMREFADLLDKQDDNIAGIYASRSGGDKDEFVELMNAETWFNADEAVQAGLADEVVEPPRTEDKQIEDHVEPSFAPQFLEHAQSVLAELDVLAERTEEVIAFRSEQGKPPLSEDSVELFERMTAVLNRLSDVPDDGRPLQDLRSELMRRRYLEG